MMTTIKDKFMATLLLDSNLLPNSWDISVVIKDIHIDSSDIYVATDRIQFMIRELLNDSIFVGVEDVGTLVGSNLAGTTYIFPGKPFDHMIAVCLFNKISAAMEGKYSVELVKVSSVQGDGIEISHMPVDERAARLVDLRDTNNSEVIDYWLSPIPSYFQLEGRSISLSVLDWDDMQLSFCHSTKSSSLVRVEEFTPAESKSEKTHKKSSRSKKSTTSTTNEN